MSSPYAIGVIISIVSAGIALIGERVRVRFRRSAEQVGWVPWPLIFILSLLLAAVFAGLWLHDS